MELSNEDNLRLNVLIHQDLKAIRIDESRMLVYALTAKGEAKVELKPNCKDEKYLRIVREMFSTHALGSPGGYPVYLRRWTRMGEMREESLQGLLLLGESEAVVAVANSPQLNEDVAERVWWAMPDADIARRMLRQPLIASSTIGKELASYLVDYLPFESEANNIVESVRLVLQPGLVPEQTVKSLWSRASRKSAYYIGFLLGRPNELPEQKPANPAYTNASELLSQEDNEFARIILRLLSPEGQAFLSTLNNAMNRLSDQLSSVLYLKAIQVYFTNSATADYVGHREFSGIEATVNEFIAGSQSKEITLIQEQGEPFSSWLESVLVLSCVGESLLDPIFSQTDAVGSVMRKRLVPVMNPIAEHINRFLAL